ncbi:MAG TPA: nucleotidyltransferase family protein [Bacteroidales bacterium]|nr:nucleotidyltransferase family protein [Bacteroidales bacterium]HPT03295.1 nucleotidyltransferase family protein [Bacteroidales bacterium]
MRQSKPDVIVLAGGLGTRLQDAVPGVPKCMATLAGKPFLEYLLNYLQNNRLQRVILSLGYLADVVKEHFGDRYGTLALEYSIEDEPLGTGGAVKRALPLAATESVFVLNGDTFFDVDLPEMLHQHNLSKALVTIALHEAQNAGRYGVVAINSDGRITSFSEKQPGVGRGLINGGIYLVEKDYLSEHPLTGTFSLEKDLFQQECHSTMIYGYHSNGYFIDIGIPDDYRRACEEIPELMRL